MRTMFQWMFSTCLLLLNPSAQAQPASTYPSRPVKILLPFAVGSSLDPIARMMAKNLQDGIGQAVIVESKSGAGGSVGLGIAAKSPSDGYTLVIGTASTHVIAPATRKSLPYDVNKDFIPLATTGPFPTLVVVNAKLPFRTLAELVTYARANPGKLNYGSSGLGTAPHIGGEIFAAAAGVKLVHVPYRGSGLAMTDLIAGQVDMVFDSPTNTSAQIAAGTVRPLAVMGPTRWPGLPNIPTTTELDYPKAQLLNWPAIFAIGGTPAPIIEKLTEALRKGFGQRETIDFFSGIDVPMNPLYGSEFAAMIRENQRTLAAALKDAQLPMLQD